MKLERLFVITAVLLLAGVLVTAGCVDSDKLAKATDNLSKTTDDLTKVVDTLTKETDTGAKTGDKVSVYYTLTVNGEQLESNFDKSPLSFTIGAGEMITGFDNGVIGMKINETKTITVSPKDGYGVYSKDNTQLFKLSEAETALEKTISVGEKLSLYNGQYIGEVLSIDRNADTMLLALNHHLAGETLTFTVKMLEIE